MAFRSMLDLLRGFQFRGLRDPFRWFGNASIGGSVMAQDITHGAVRVRRSHLLSALAPLGSMVCVLACVVGITLGGASAAYAAKIDPSVARFLLTDGVAEVAVDETGTTRTFTGQDLTQGKALFNQNCAFCHMGGATFPLPTVSLSRDALAGATPPRTTIASMVEFIRHPMVYDGSEESLDCREVSESWLADAEVTNLAAFILRSAEKAPDWGLRDLSN